MVAGSVRSRVYRQLEPAAWPRKGLSLTNWLLAILIIIAVTNAALETEPTISLGRERLFDEIEVTVASIFLVEYLARLWIVPENPKFAGRSFPRLRYALTPIAIIDLAAIVPAFFTFGGSGIILRFFRVLRMLRLAKLGRASRAWEMIRDAIHERRYEFALVLGLVLVAVLFAGSLMYWAEADAQPDTFGSIPRALWWAVVTLTTIGYGDAYPVTAVGRILATFIALAGVMLIALPTGLFAASFTEGIRRHQERIERQEGPDA